MLLKNSKNRSAVRAEELKDCREEVGLMIYFNNETES
jgi:hypothetical protein